VIALSNNKRRHILRDTRTTSHHNVRSDDAELMDCAHTADDHVIIDDDVTA
jgi:hypothetical protein